MKLAILKIILWPKDPNHPPRIIHFEPGKINIVTGESGTGKSTLTSIIDYCLGSYKCTIPVGLIRDVTGWFGLHVKLANTELIIARRNPEEQQSTSDLYWAEGLSVPVPPVVQKNARVEDLKNRLNQIAHLPGLDFSISDDVGFGGPPSSRDMAAFNFQPRHIVANPYTYFFKADTTEHREKLQIIFPLVLGAVDGGTLAKQRELKDAEREHERLNRELQARLRAARAWEAEVQSYYLQARMLGLLPDSLPSDPNWTLEKYILELSKVPDVLRREDMPDIPQGTVEAAVADLTSLINEEDRLSQHIGSLQRRLSKLDQLTATVNDYGTALTSQEDRIRGVGWFEEKIGDSYECPVCTAVHANGSPELTELQALAREFKQISDAVSEAPAKLDHELADLREEVRRQELEMSKIRQKRKALENRSNELAAQRQRIRQTYLFVGRLEQALENVTTSHNVDDIRQKLNAKAAEISALRRELDPVAQRQRLQAAIDRVSTRIAEYARLLRLEHANENVRLNIKELTLEFNPLSGRKDFLWELGSGQNWVGYHIAGVLALHEHFVTLKHNAVPRFLLIDQPSQVYFPEAWPSMDEPPSNKTSGAISADIEGVRRIFTALAQFMATVKMEFQIIITEHAGEITWRGVPDVHLVGNWRQGHDEFLIPRAWLIGRE